MDPLPIKRSNRPTQTLCGLTLHLVILPNPLPRQDEFDTSAKVARPSVPSDSSALHPEARQRPQPTCSCFAL